MKTNRSKNTRTAGSVLLVTMCILGVAAICIASYLMMVQTQSASVARSQSWNNVIPVSEAGVEEGLALVNIGAPNIIARPTDWTNSVAACGWSAFVGGKTSLTRSNVSGSGTSYTVTVDISSGTPTITSTGVVPYTSIPWVFSSTQTPLLGAIGMQPFLAQSQSTSTANIGRKVQVQTVLNPLFSLAVITKSNFDMNGNGTTVDSFDSSNPLYSTTGQYDSSKRKAGGSIGTDASIVGDISIGNGNIYGHVYTGPGTAQNSVQVGSQGAVGDAAWNASHSGIEAGYWGGDFNVNIPDVSAPSTGVLTTLPAPNIVTGIVNLPAGNYTISPNDPNIGMPLNVVGSATVWVQGSYSPPTLTIASTNGAKLVLYLGAASGSGYSLSLSGNGNINQNLTANSANLQIYGLPSLTSISFHGNAGFEGVIYAPEAAMTGGGGGNNVQDTSGAMIVKSVTLNGHWNFHYDENLQNIGPSRGWIAKNWTELKYP